MARITFAKFTAHDVFVSDSGVAIERRPPRAGVLRRPVLEVPVLWWSNGQLWDCANLYISHRIDSVVGDELDFVTVKREADHLRAFAAFLEERGLQWHAFGADKDQKPTYAFRGHLLRKRRERKLAPSTATARMGAVIRFYRWVLSQGLITQGVAPFEQREHLIHVTDQVGFSRSMTVASTNLSIRNRQRGRGVRLEGGLKPVSLAMRNTIMALAREVATPEFALQLAVGFLTGARLQTILDLKVQTLKLALPAETPEARYLSVGPGATPPVDTKFGITGRIIVPTAFLNELLEYATSERRMSRVSKASPEQKDLLFLNRFGRPYEPVRADRSRSINKDMARLRNSANLRGIDLSGFYFHCTRSTFATLVATVGLSRRDIPPIAVIGRIKELLLHRSETDSQRYIDYVHESNAQIAIEQEFSDWLFTKRPTQTQ